MFEYSTSCAGMPDGCFPGVREDVINQSPTNETFSGIRN